MKIYRYLLESATNSNICQSTLSTVAIAVSLLHFLDEICKFSSIKREKEKKYHRSFLKATKRKSGPPNRAEPRCLPRWWHVPLA